MSSLNRRPRIVGALYLIFILAGPLRLMVIPSRLFVKGDAAATTANILAHEGLFRLGIATDVFIAALAEMFWGLWLLPLAVLVWRSGFMPRFIGAWLVLNGVAYVVWSLVALLAPDHESTIASWAFPFQLGELVFMLWLLTMGDWWGRRSATAQAPAVAVAAIWKKTE